MDEIMLRLTSPITDEQMDAIMDVDFDHTNRISFHTKHGKDVEFIKVDRVIKILEGKIESEQNRAEQANVEGEGQWVVAHIYAEIVLGGIVEQIRREEATDAT